ncbi:MAG: VCBS repeat-containing protein, partial [Planctomycetes bacterium]|nr:VCBS repeat-containing protein [Planctomycetota bacterium]
PLTGGGVAAGVVEGTNAPPALAVVSPGQGPAGGGTTITLVGSGFTSVATTQVFVGGQLASGLSAPDGLTFIATTPAGTPGDADVRVHNPNGDSSIPAAFHYGPAITGVAPNEGAVGGGTVVTISGNGFTTNADTEVRFGGVLATPFNVVDARTITAVSPPGAVGPVDITVSNPSGLAALADGFVYRIAPAISSVEPPYGPTSGGTLVTVRGAGFLDASRMTLRFGGAAATSLVVLDPTMLQAITPRGIQGAVDVSLATPLGTPILPGGWIYGLAFPLFDAALDQFVTLGPSDIQVADLDQDGLLDVITCNELNGPATIAFYRGRGNGDFAPPESITVRTGNTSPSSIALGDLDEDGYLDVIVTEAGSSSATTFLWDGAGFSQTTTVTTGLGPQSARLARLDADAHLDFLCVNARTGNLTFRRGDGLGGFGPRTTIDVPAGTAASPVAVAIADLDGDSNLDFATANNATNTVSVAFNDGTGVFTFGPDLAVGNSPSAILATDLTGDGHVDIAVCNQADGTVSVLLGVGGGAFAAAQTFSCWTGSGSARPAAIAGADVDGDGRMDLVVANSGTDSAVVLLGDGAGNFGAPLVHPVGQKPVAIVAANLAGPDARPDIVTVNEDSSTFSLLLNHGGTPTSAPRTSAGTDPIDSVTADFDRDGDADLAVLDAGSGLVRLFLGQGTGTFAIGATLTVGSGATAIAMGDLDQDGIVDLAVTRGAADQVVAFIGDGFGGFSPGRSSSVGFQPASIAIGRFDGDAFPDVALGNLGDGTVSIVRNDGTGRFAGELRIDPGITPESIVAGDFDEDSRLDVAAVGATPSNAGALVIVRGDGFGGFFDAPFFGVAEHLRSVTVGDLDGDGHLDVVASGVDENGTLDPFADVFLGEGTANFVISGLRVGNDPRSARLADVDADGRLDLVLANRGSAGVSVLLGDGTGGFTRGMFNFATGFRPVSISIADFDRSGSPDLAVVNRGGRSFSFVRSRS